jgi:hypothetical protein
MSREYITKLQLWLKGYKEYSQSYEYDKKYKKNGYSIKIGIKTETWNKI